MKLTCHLFLFCTDSSDADFRNITKIVKLYYLNAKFVLSSALNPQLTTLEIPFFGNDYYQATTVMSSHSCFSTQPRFKFMRYCHAKISCLPDVYFLLTSVQA